MMSQELYLQPRARPFDLAWIEKHLRMLSYVGKDPVEGRLFMIAADATDLRLELEHRERTGRFVDATLVELKPEYVLLYHIGGKETLRNSRAFAQWMLDEYDCRILNDSSEDVTEYAKRNAARLYPDDLT